MWSLPSNGQFQWSPLLTYESNLCVKIYLSFILLKCILKLNKIINLEFSRRYCVVQRLYSDGALERLFIKVRITATLNMLF